MRVCVPSHFSHIQLFSTVWTVVHQAPLCMGFSRQEYWGGLLYPPSGDLPDSGIEPVSLTSFALAGGFFTTRTTGEALIWGVHVNKPLCVFLLLLIFLSLWRMRWAGLTQEPRRVEGKFFPSSTSAWWVISVTLWTFCVMLEDPHPLHGSWPTLLDCGFLNSLVFRASYFIYRVPLGLMLSPCWWPFMRRWGWEVHCLCCLHIPDRQIGSLSIPAHVASEGKGHQPGPPLAGAGVLVEWWSVSTYTWSESRSQEIS